jgi:ABC-type sugar transport system substrate-binding protein
MGALAVGCRPDHRRSGRKDRGRRRRLRAAFSTAGLKSTWSRSGQKAAMLWGELLDVDVHWFDGEGDVQKHRESIEAIADDSWDFCALQPLQTGSLEEAVKRLKGQGIPVISMDMLPVERDRLRDVGVWVHVGADHVYMAEVGTQYLISTIKEQGKLIHVGGQSGHSSAQDREKGFTNIVSLYPDIEVVGGGVQWCDWDATRAREAFEALLQKSEEPIAGAFFHSDEMALACVPALTGTRHESMAITALDGQREGLTAVRDGELAATVVNPTGMIHGWSLIIGQFIVRNEEQIDDLPLEIICPSTLVARETGNLEAMLYLADPEHALI